MILAISTLLAYQMKQIYIFDLQWRENLTSVVKVFIIICISRVIFVLLSNRKLQASQSIASNPIDDEGSKNQSETYPCKKYFSRAGWWISLLFKEDASKSIKLSLYVTKKYIINELFMAWGYITTFTIVTTSFAESQKLQYQ